MNRTLLSFSRWLLGCLFLLGTHSARASHAQGGQLTYESLGNNQYRITLAYVRECSGIIAPTNFVLQTRNVCGGAAGPSTTLNPVGTPVVSTPYCPSVQATTQCPLTSSAPLSSPLNFAIHLYQGVVTLPPAPEWIIAVEESARPTVANLTNTGNTLRWEATLNNRITLQGGGTVDITNNSAQFINNSSPMHFACWRLPSTASFTATDADRLNGGRADSLVYSLDQPLGGCGIPVPYTVYPASSGQIVLQTNPPCVLTGVSARNYSASLPILVAEADTVGACPQKVLEPRFRFNSTNGSFTFAPARYLTTSPAYGDNKYAVVGKVTEYRRINGRYYKVGSVRRDFMVIVVDCGTNQLPLAPAGIVADTLSHASVHTSTDTSYYTIRTCTYTRISVPFTDPNNTAALPSAQPLTVTYPADVNTVRLQNGDVGQLSISGNGGPRPIATLQLQPGPNMAGQTVLIPLQAHDDGCPIYGVRNRVLVLRIVSSQAQARIQGAGIGGTATICPGGSLTLVGRGSRPDSVWNVASGQVQPVAQNYTYQWSAPNNHGLPAVTNVAGITVNPTTTTRYLLRVTGTGGAAGCGADTVSVLVRVVPAPVASITVSSAVACTGGSVLLEASAQRPDNLLDTYTYTWSGPGIPAGTTGQSLLVEPIGSSTYVLTATGASGCEGTTSVQLGTSPTPAPPAPVLSRNGNTLSSSASTGNQWYLNRQRLPGATAQTLTPTAPGDYSATVSVGGCTSAPATAQRVLATRSAESATSISVVPNPTADGHVSVLLTGYHQALELRLLDVLGRPLRTATLPAPNPAGSRQQLDLSALPAGVYLLQVRSSQGLTSRRIVRQ